MTKEQKIIKKIDLAEKEYSKTINIICEEIRKEILIPWCYKRKLTFDSGMGSYFFLRKDKILYDRQIKPSILEMMETPLLYSYCIGPYINKITEEDLKAYEKQMNNEGDKNYE